MNVFSHFYYAFHLNAWVYCVHVHECACIWGGNRHHVFSSIIIYFILLSQGLSLNLQFFNWLDWLAQEPQEPQVLYDLSQVLEFQRWSVISFTLPAEPSFWLLCIFFENMSISLLKHIYYKVTKVLCVFWVLGTYQVDYSQIYLCFIPSISSMAISPSWLLCLRHRHKVICCPISPSYFCAFGIINCGDILFVL